MNRNGDGQEYRTGFSESDKRSSATNAVPLLVWVRARDGWIGGVCKGLADSFGISAGLIRLCWVLATLLFGLGVLIYLAVWISFPREDRIPQALRSWILGFCFKLSRRFNNEVGLVRLIFLLLLFTTGGVFLLFYLLGALVLWQEDGAGPDVRSTRQQRHAQMYPDQKD